MKPQRETRSTNHLSNELLCAFPNRLRDSISPCFISPLLSAGTCFQRKSYFSASFCQQHASTLKKYPRYTNTTPRRDLTHTPKTPYFSLPRTHRNCYNITLYRRFGGVGVALYFFPFFVAPSAPSPATGTALLASNYSRVRTPQSSLGIRRYICEHNRIFLFLFQLMRTHGC